MATYAMNGDQLVKVGGLGERARCHDPSCNWEMIARPGNGHVQPHWAHRPGSSHIIGTGEKGEWHLEVQGLFKLFGARLEVEVPGRLDKSHRADVQCANGIIVEAQTHFLNPAETEARESAYGTNMLWLYDARDEGAWFSYESNDPGRFWWRKPDRRFFTHARPIFFDTPTGVWQLDTLHPVSVKQGRKGYHGIRHKVAGELVQFVELVTNGHTFGPAPRMYGITDARKSMRGTRAGKPQDVNAWLSEHPVCYYDGDIEVVVKPTEIQQLLEITETERQTVLAEIMDDGRPPIEFICPRCKLSANARFYGPCPTCRAELRAVFRASV